MMDPPSLLNNFSNNYMALEKKNKELTQKLQEI